LEGESLSMPSGVYIRTKPVSEETKKKLSISNSGKKLTEEHKKKISLSKIGNPMSEETKKKMSESHKGEKNYNYGKSPKKRSEESIKRQSLKMMGENNPNFGKHMSEEAKVKRSLKMCGINHPNFGKPMLEDQRIKISMTHQGIENIDDWDGYVKEKPYCNIYTIEFRMRQYEITGYRCLICGDILDIPECHHVYWQKSSCCQNMDESGELFFTIYGQKFFPSILPIPHVTKEKEIEYGLNKFASLCESCHGMIRGKKNVKSLIDYIRDIEDIINTKYGGRSYYTKEEFWGNGYYHKKDGVEKFYDAITGEYYGKYLSGFVGWGLPKQSKTKPKPL